MTISLKTWIKQMPDLSRELPDQTLLDWSFPIALSRTRRRGPKVPGYRNVLSLALGAKLCRAISRN